jgi:cytidylate kinase
MEGRDIGSVVFPDTPYKFYIDASPEVRERRRRAEGIDDSIAARDKMDSSRKASPLVIPNDATVVDSSHLTIEEVVGKLKEVIVG